MELQGGNQKIEFKLSSGRVVTVTMLDGVDKLLVAGNKPDSNSTDTGNWIATVVVIAIWLAASATAYQQGGIITLWCVGIMAAAVCAVFLFVLWYVPENNN